jgi:hypothetical protein
MGGIFRVSFLFDESMLPDEGIMTNYAACRF